MRRLVAVLPLLVLLTGCRGESFCGTVHRLNDTTGAEASVDIGPGDSQSERDAKIAAFGAALRVHAQRRRQLLGRLDRTAPNDLRADVRVVTKVDREIVAATVDDDSAGSGAGLLDIAMRVGGDAGLRAANAHVRAATRDRCGEAYGVPEAPPLPGVPPVPTVPPLRFPTFPPVPSFPAFPTGP